MMKTICLSIALLAFASFFRTGDCTITGWTPADGAVHTTVLDDGDNTATAAAFSMAPTSDDNSVTGCTITQSPSDGATFAIDIAGAITISAGTVDYPVAPAYTFVVTCTDGAGAASATVTLSINDNPSFQSTFYDYCIADGSAVGTTVATLTASDAVGTLSAYTLPSGNTNMDFAVTAGTITTANVMDASTTLWYLLEMVVDDGSLSTTATILVDLRDSCCSGGAGIIASVLTLLMALIVSMH